MARQGKCKHCKARITWKENINLNRCACPICGEKLEATTWLSKLRSLEQRPIYWSPALSAAQNLARGIKL